MAEHNPWHPLERNPVTNELFLRLRKHRDVIITPPRPEDVDSILESMNDPRVYHWLASNPHPYLREHAEATWLKGKKRTDAALEELEEAGRENPPKLVNSCPVSVMRKVREDGPDEFVGNVVIARCHHGETLNTDSIDWEHRAQNEAENDAKELGDPTIVWSIGNFVAAKFHGQGIMTDVVDTILHDWAVPRMGARLVLVGAFNDNIGSIRVFEKNGFRSLRVIPKYQEIRGIYRDLRLLEWRWEG